MSNGRVYNRDFLLGLQTTRPADGADDFTGFRRFQNVRVDRDEARIRPGRVRLTKITPNTTVSSCCEFNGSSTWRAPLSYAAPRPNIWGLSARTRWTLELLIKDDLTTANQGILAVGSINPLLEFWVDGNSKLVARLVNRTAGIHSIVGPTVTTAVTHLRLEGVDGVVNFYVDGVLAGSATPTSGLYENPTGYLTAGRVFGAGAYWFDGRIEHVTLYDGLLPDFRGMRNHLLAPRQPRVLACYRGPPSVDGTTVVDHSRFELHALKDAGAVATGSTIANPHNPVQGIVTFIDKRRQRRIAVAAGGSIYGGTP